MITTHGKVDWMLLIGVAMVLLAIVSWVRIGSGTTPRQECARFCQDAPAWRIAMGDTRPVIVSCECLEGRDVRAE